MGTYPDYVHQHFARHPGPVRKALVCADGFKMSVQASEAHYCTPRQNDGPWSHVEVWCCTNPDGTLSRVLGCRKNEPSGWVPVVDVNAVIHLHGGLKGA